MGAETGREPGIDEFPGIDTSVAHPARVYDYWLGGTVNFPADREAAERVLAVTPGLRMRVRANRDFLARVVHYMAGPAGIDQFLDIGTGIPSANNTHEVAQAVRPSARVVYVDNDPIVLLHASELLRGTLQGVTDFVQADIRDPRHVLAAAERTIDLNRPVGLILIGMLHLLSDEEDPWALVAELMGALPSGSYLAISHPALEIAPGQQEAQRRYNERVATKQTLRTREQVERFFTGLEMVEPGLVQVHQWRPEPESMPPSGTATAHGGLARKP